MAINLSFLRGLWGRLGERTKLGGVAVLAFVIGTLWGGHGTVANENGRYVGIGTEGRIVQDTRSGEVWIFDSSDHTYKRQGAPTRSWF